MKKQFYQFSEQLLTASKQAGTVRDIAILKNVSASTASKLKKGIKNKLGDTFIYPIPMSVLLEELNIDISSLEKAAYREQKLLKLKKDAS